MSLLKPQQHLILCPPNKQKTKSGNTDFAAQVKMKRSSANFPFSITSLCFFLIWQWLRMALFAISARPLTQSSLAGQIVDVGVLHLRQSRGDLGLWEMC